MVHSQQIWLTGIDCDAVIGWLTSHRLLLCCDWSSRHPRSSAAASKIDVLHTASHQAAPYTACAINSNTINSTGLGQWPRRAYHCESVGLLSGIFVEKCPFLVMTTPLDIKPSRYFGHGLYAAACKILPLLETAWLIEHGFTSAPTQYRLYGRRFLQVWWPNQQCQSTEGGWFVIQTGLSLTMLTSPCYNTTTCMQLLHKKII